MLTKRMIPGCIRLGRITPARTCTRRFTLQEGQLRSAHVAQRRAFRLSARLPAAQTTADEVIEEIQELYATARDEFEIAAEETEKMTVYAEDDRVAAREELTKLQQAYKSVVQGPDKSLAEEVQRRVGQRIRELENAVEALEELAKSHD